MLNVLSVCSASVKKMQTLPSLFSCCQTSLSQGDLPNGWSHMPRFDYLLKNSELKLMRFLQQAVPSQ